MKEVEHFIMLDIPDTVIGNEFDRSYPYVQIVFPSSENSYCDKKVRGNHPENGLTNRERRKYFCSIAIDVDSDYKVGQFNWQSKREQSFSNIF